MQEEWRGKHVFTLDIVWDGKHEMLQVFENDEPCIISAHFVQDNQLPEVYAKLIENEIESRIQELLDSEMVPEESHTENIETLTRSISEKKTEYRISRSNSPNHKKNNRKLVQYKKVFQFLTPFKKISPDTMACIDLKHRVCRILLPLLIDLNSSDQLVDFMTFCCKMDALIKVLPQNDWDFLMSFQADLREISPEAKNKKYQRTLFDESVSKKYH